MFLGLGNSLDVPYGTPTLRLLDGRPPTAEHQVYSTLQQRILDGILRPGERIDLEAVASELAMSRTPVRMALLRLESEGLVTVYPHRAAVVTDVSAADLEQIYAVRIHLETMAARQAVPKLKNADLAKVRGIHQIMAASLDTANLAAFTQYDRTFHLALYQAANNKFLTDTIDELRKGSLRFLTACAPLEWLVSAVAEHEEILAAATSRDGERVAQLIEQSLSNTCEHIITELSTRVA